MKITIVGAGYVGLVSGSCFAEFGFEVTCVDKDTAKIDALNQGIIPIYEPGLDSLVSQGIKAKRLTFTTQLSDTVKTSDVVMIAVGTPTRRGDGYADLTYLYKATEEIAEFINGYTVVVTKSTVPVGTSREIAEIIKKIRPELIEGISFDVASNPEFLREGAAINDFIRPDRVVIGTNSTKASEVLQKLYRPLYLIETPIVSTTPGSYCGTGEVILSADQTPAVASVAWYDSPVSTTPLSIGNNFGTGVISGTTTFYVEALNSGNGQATM